MASLVPNRGLARIGIQASQATGHATVTYSATRHIQTMAWDIGTTAFAAAHTKLNDSANVTEANTSYYDQPLTPVVGTASGQTITFTGIIPTGAANVDGNFVSPGIRRISLHDDAIANVTSSSATLVSGVDSQSLVKTPDFQMTTLLKHLHTSA